MAHGFVRIGDELETRLEPIERVMIRDLLDELCELLTNDGDIDLEDQDPLARQLGLGDLADGEVDAPEDPVLNRLLPDGYRNDPIAASEFRHYTDGALRRGKIEDAEIIRAGLDRADGDPDGAVTVTLQAASAWLRSINDLRLALGVQLEITPESAEELADLPDDDPRATMAAMYDFLTWWQDSLVRVLLADS